MQYKKLFKIASKSNIRSELTHIYLKNGQLYATDAYKGIITKPQPHLASIEGYITETNAHTADLYAKARKEPAIPAIEPDIKAQAMGAFPDMDAIVMKDDDHMFTIQVNRQYLIDLLEAMQKPDDKKKNDTIEIMINKKHQTKPLQLQNENAIGLLMPMNR